MGKLVAIGATAVTVGGLLGFGLGKALFTEPVDLVLAFVGVIAGAAFTFIKAQKLD